HAVVRKSLPCLLRKAHHIPHAVQALVVGREHRYHDIWKLDRADAAGVAKACAAVDEHNVEGLSPPMTQPFDKGPTLIAEESFPIKPFEITRIFLVLFASTRQERDRKGC